MKNKKPIDWENPFCAKDFENLEDYSGPDAQNIAEQANARFRSILKEHGRKIIMDELYWSFDSDEAFKSRAIKQGILIAEKEITDETR